MTDMLVTVVNISIMLRQQVDIMKDETVERVMLKRLQHSGVVKSAFVEHSITSLYSQQPLSICCCYCCCCYYQNDQSPGTVKLTDISRTLRSTLPHVAIYLCHAY